MVIRKEYLSRLLAWKNEQVIKVVTGIRRCGKSTLLKQFQEHLLQEGVSQEQIISINFEDLDYEGLLDYKALYAYIKERLCPDKMTYIFLDEIQKVDSFQKAVDSLFIKECITKRLKVFRVPITIGTEVPRPSTWFSGYHEKFFFDRGVLYYHLYGCMAKPLAMRFLVKHKAQMCREIPVRKAYALMKDGMREAAK